ncbi:hypothetical protein GOL24_28860 [Sinorhizobium medicae]|nr:hypothetical protein [Sinorhizobium medicae]MDX1231532.1 hypothetical protein [Sinorhizobium medicae]
MKYRYALTASGETVDILDLSRDRPISHEHFICFSCKSDLIPVLGLRREKHFRHRFEGTVPCSRETYLHALAKKRIFDGFLAAVQTKRPYFLTIPVERHCTRWLDELGVICEQPMGRRDIDLTHYFKCAQEEAMVNGFVADVLLTSSSNKTLLIEVAVTHRCEPAKISSGLPIVEVSVTDEDQCAHLAMGIDARADNVDTYNFKRQTPVEVACLPHCSTELSAFFVYKSGKSHILTATPEKIAEQRKRQSTIYSHVIQPQSIVEHFVATGGYQSEAQRAFREGVPVKCCFLCRYAGLDAREKPVFCKIRKTEVGVNEAAICSAYRPERR